jgi:biopolymer transport protein ExbD
MAEKHTFLDAWIVETNTAYRKVPFSVVADWIQQGRLLASDKLRSSGQTEWFCLGDNPTFAAYLPRSEPYRTEDQAEALEPVQVDFNWKPRSDDEDEDVDMIPLIDVSLVLLIFFIMTTTGAFLATRIQTPGAFFGWLSSDPATIWIGIDMDLNKEPIYSIGVGDQPPASKEDEGLMTRDQVLQRLDAKLAEAPRFVDVVIRAHEDLPSGIVRRLQVELERRPKIMKKHQAVSEKKAP